ncbi:hypothetical protein ETD83_25175 [Actinomadura soli]|uniref:Uncharacterized protein n=1 Tax=Actinomadura soli TaxID=2508997 RepID=A0A5C4J8R7_9ACTN|nr:hypothetical protein [Actinomadura soli]TMQ93570.1 hypothetical protein ETD83_25175 [Actinomadura soli]
MEILGGAAQVVAEPTLMWPDPPTPVGAAASAEAWPGAEAVLKLRTVIANGSFPGYWSFHTAIGHRRLHRTRDQEGYELSV